MPFDASSTPLSSVITGLNLLLAQDIADDAVFCAVAAKRLQRVLQGRWLPPEARRSSDEAYQRHLLYEDAEGRFSIGSFVWRPGQETPVHDHTCWSVVGVLEGQLFSENFDVEDDGGRLTLTSKVILRPGVTTWLAPATGDIHRIVNPSTWANAISIHVYGSTFAAACRSRYDVSSGDGHGAGEASAAPAPAQPQPVRQQ
jgi:predicted metal-dependent enzyme (double-stranded beta helix superfamily)